MNKTQIGDYSEQLFVLYCLKNEIPICKPIGNNLPYDFVIEVEDKLLKIQVKTAYHTANSPEFSYTFNTRSCSKNYSEVTNSNYIGKIDYFAVVNQELNKPICFIPIDKAAKGSMSIYYGDNPKPQQNDYKAFLSLK